VPFAEVDVQFTNEHLVCIADIQDRELASRFNILFFNSVELKISWFQRLSFVIRIQVPLQHACSQLVQDNLIGKSCMSRRDLCNAINKRYIAFIKMCFIN
jgi:hypothetical protein